MKYKLNKETSINNLREILLYERFVCRNEYLIVNENTLNFIKKECFVSTFIISSEGLMSIYDLKICLCNSLNDMEIDIK